MTEFDVVFGPTSPGNTTSNPSMEGEHIPWHCQDWWGFVVIPSGAGDESVA